MRADGRVIRGDRGIICTGGLSYPATGSTGDGYRFAEKTGNRLVGQGQTLDQLHKRPALLPGNLIHFSVGTDAGQ